MMKSRKIWSAVSLSMIFAMLLAACTSAEPQVVEVEVTREVEVEVITEVEVEVPVETIVEVEVPVELEQGPQGTLVASLTTFPNSLDIPQAAERNASIAGSHLFDALVWLDGKGVAQPALATDWSISDDGLVYTFNLRDDVDFHNGEHFTADSVVFSWERAANSTFEYFYNWTSAESVVALEDYVLEITLGAPQPTFLGLIFDAWAVVPRGYLEEVGEEGFAEHPVGTGPYMFVEWVKGDRIVFEANPNYYGDPGPLVQNLIFRPIPESATRVAAIQTGEIDIAKRLSAEEAQSLVGVDGVKVVSYPADRVYYISFNNLSTGIGTPIEDPNVRIAMNLAVDRQAIVDALFNGQAALSTSFVVPSNFGYNPDIEPFPYDPELAQQMLADAGYADGFDVEFRCPIGAYTNFEQVCEAVQGYLTDVGINTNLELMESGQYWDLEAAKELPPLFGDSWSNALAEPINRIQGALLEENSYAAFSSPELVEIIDTIATTVDDDARIAAYFEYQELMQSDPPFIWLYEPLSFEAITLRVQNYMPRAAETYYVGHDGTFVADAGG